MTIVCNINCREFVMFNNIAFVARRSLRRLGALALMLCLYAALNVVTATPSFASPVCMPDDVYYWKCVGADTYTAIAFSETDWSWGASWNAATREQAEAMALAECRKRARDCKSQAWAVNACVAWATSDGDGIWGTGWNIFVDTAEARALGNCRRAGGKHCVIRAHPCADG
jgi:hypothetical protein